MRTSSDTRFQIRTAVLTMILIASGVAAALISIGCRGGGANPGDEDLLIPFVEPTQSSRTCLNEVYPPDSPTFEEVSESDYLPGANGVDYVVIEPGNGDKPQEDWQIEVKYTGWLEDGCVFGTTYGSGRDARFFLAYVIPGWRQSLLEMQLGERRRIRVPPDQGYGQAGSPPRIPANATLYFDVTLTSGLTAEEAQATATAVNEAAAATITAVSQEVEATFTAVAEEASQDPESLSDEKDSAK